MHKHDTNTRAHKLNKLLPSISTFLGSTYLFLNKLLVLCEEMKRRHKRSELANTHTHTNMRTPTHTPAQAQAALIPARNNIQSKLVSTDKYYPNTTHSELCKRLECVYVCVFHQ